MKLLKKQKKKTWWVYFMYLFHEEPIENIDIMDACSKSILELIGQTLFFIYLFF